MTSIDIRVRLLRRALAASPSDSSLADRLSRAEYRAGVYATCADCTAHVCHVAASLGRDFGWPCGEAQCAACMRKDIEAPTQDSDQDTQEFYFRLNINPKA